MTSTFSRNEANREVDGDEPFNVYDTLEWMDERDYIKHLANGRSMVDCGPEVKRELLRMIFGSPIFCLRNYLYTTNKYGDLVRLDPWLGQTVHDYAIESQRRRGLAQMIAEIKARQVGFTAHNLAPPRRMRCSLSCLTVDVGRLAPFLAYRDCLPGLLRLIAAQCRILTA